MGALMPKIHRNVKSGYSVVSDRSSRLLYLHMQYIMQRASLHAYVDTYSYKLQHGRGL